MFFPFVSNACCLPLTWWTWLPCVCSPEGGFLTFSIPKPYKLGVKKVVYSRVKVFRLHVSHLIKAPGWPKNDLCFITWLSTICFLLTRRWSELLLRLAAAQIHLKTAEDFVASYPCSSHCWPAQGTPWIALINLVERILALNIQRALKGNSAFTSVRPSGHFISVS